MAVLGIPSHDGHTTPPPDWGALFQQHRAAMQRVAAHILHHVGRRDLAEDAVMQAMVSLIAHPPAEIDNPEALLIAASKRKASDIKKLHDIARRAKRVLRDTDVQSSDIAPGVVDQIDQQRTVQKALDEVARLPVLQQQIIREVIMKGHPARQVAAELGLSPARVSQVRTAALATLREQLGEGRSSR